MAFVARFSDRTRYPRPKGAGGFKRRTRRWRAVPVFHWTASGGFGRSAFGARARGEQSGRGGRTPLDSTSGTRFHRSRSAETAWPTEVSGRACHCCITVVRRMRQHGTAHRCTHTHTLGQVQTHARRIKIPRAFSADAIREGQRLKWHTPRTPTAERSKENGPPRAHVQGEAGPEFNRDSVGAVVMGRSV